MRPLNDLAFPANPLWLVVLLLLLVLPGCSGMTNVPVSTVPREVLPEEELQRNRYALTAGDDLVGRLAEVRLDKGDTLPDIARHFSLGITELSAANPGVDIWAPRSGVSVLLPLSHILPDTPRKGIVINLAAMRLFHFKGDDKSPVVWTYPVGVGSSERPSPTGQMYVQRKTTRPTWYVPTSIAEDHRKKGDPLPSRVLPGPLNPLGEYALYLSKSTYLIHGTNKPYSIGLNATNGCIRLYPEDVKKLYENTPVNTPVSILNQPYLVGRRDGNIYLEVHASPENTDQAQLDRMYAKLRNLERKVNLRIDWLKVEEALAQARGTPVPLAERAAPAGDDGTRPVEVKHPERLFGSPDVPDVKTDGWYVLAAELTEKVDAARLAAIINHQGPPIPARILPRKKGYRVIAGPFGDENEARDAAKRLKIDLEIDGVIIGPDRPNRQAAG